MPDAVYTLPDLTYDFGALEPHISGEIMELHHDKHHKAYVDGANKALEQLATSRETDDFGTLTKLQKDLAFHVSGHVLHSIFWTNLGPDGGEPTGILAEQLDRDFGGVERFKAHVTNAAQSVQGSGWAVAAWEPTAKRVIVSQVYDHQGNHGQGTLPLLVVDAWEHAYYLQYKNVKADWVDAFWNIVNWPDVTSRFDNAQSLKLL
jgi:Fe-Mn family superoxide dismutase